MIGGDETVVISVNSPYPPNLFNAIICLSSPNLSKLQGVANAVLASVTFPGS